MTAKTTATKKPKEKLLVANRSEIACRIFQACRELNIGTVAIFDPRDHEARHLTYADEVYPVTSYLDVASILDVIQKTGTRFVHPGYGFLSERAVFARALEAAGIDFLGPRPETIDLLGGKIAAKELAAKAGVPTLPWAKVPTGGDLKAAAKTVGFPLLLKASAGGGGKGMRKVTSSEELTDAAESASQEALSAFGDGTLFLERLVETPRHIEVQVFGDGMGGGVHLHERECSLQRRHQKIWEEAPAPRLRPETRAGLVQAALSLVQTTSYRSAGTVEFLVDEEEHFYFLEMNTRLQVEHPVTESVTGVDLVVAQIEQARNPKTPFFKEAPSVRGHSIEVRIYAEDPYLGFIPTPGTIRKIIWPTGPGIRVDSGIEEGQTITTLFDSMLAKLIVTAPDRAHAIRRMQYALEETAILGIGTNIPYLLALTKDPRVAQAQVYTQYLEKEFPAKAELSDLQRLALAAADQAPSSGSNAPGMAAASPNNPLEWNPWFSASSTGSKT